MRHLSVILATTLLLTSCGGDPTTSVLDQFEPEIVNEPGTFQFQVTDATNVSTTLSYTWLSAGSRVSIDHSSALSGGTAALTLLDADGTQVYSSPLKASGSEMSAEGVAGAWTVRLTFHDASGTMNFRTETQ